jgi:hypothetical protein
MNWDTVRIVLALASIAASLVAIRISRQAEAASREALERHDAGL